MRHYFDSKADETLEEPIELTYQFADMTFHLWSDKGVFSRQHIDEASQLLMQSITPKAGDKLLDLGCGYGIIGLVMARYYKADVSCVDVNPKAIALTKRNFKAYEIVANIICADGLEPFKQTHFDWILSNPPIRIGKDKLYPLLASAIEHLSDDGTFVFVMHKKHGVASAVRFLSDFTTVKVLNKAKGFQVVACKKR